MFDEFTTRFLYRFLGHVYDDLAYDKDPHVHCLETNTT